MNTPDAPLLTTLPAEFGSKRAISHGRKVAEIVRFREGIEEGAFDVSQTELLLYRVHLS
jgi:hypothetical protein